MRAVSDKAQRADRDSPNETPRKRRRRSPWRSGAWLSWIVAAIAFDAATVHASALVVGQTAPPITLDTLDGRHIDTRDLVGKVVVVTFWATWCEPCREELPALSRYASEHASEGLIVLGFSLDGPDNLDQVRSIAARLAFPVGLLGDPHVAGYGRIWRLPVSFTIDRRGRLADDGWKDDKPVWDAARLQRVITPLLADSAAVSTPP